MDSVESVFCCAGCVGWLAYSGFVAVGESAPACVGLCLGKLQGKRWGPSGCFHFFFFLLFSPPSSGNFVWIYVGEGGCHEVSCEFFLLELRIHLFFLESVIF